MMGPAAATLAAGARPVPPGRTGTGPGERMPVYQPPLAASWNGAARGVPNAPTPPTITSHPGTQANGYVNSSHPIKPWSNGAHMSVREGQIMFIARNNPRKDSGDPWSEFTTEASLQHLNMMCEQGWRAARGALQRGTSGMPPGIRISLEDFDAISEWDIFDYLGAREVDIPDDMPMLKEACKLLHVDVFKYLLPIGVLMYWNLYGGVSNISYGTAPQASVNEYTKRTVVVNHNVAKKGVLSNIWGDQKRLVEGAKIGLVCRRKRNADGTPGATEFVPWAQLDAITPPMCSRSYRDELGRDQKGYFLYIGTVSEVDVKEMSERYRRDAIGNNGKPASVVHNAYGTLPRITVQWGV